MTETAIENKYALVPKDILEMCEFEEDYTDAWNIAGEKIENINTLKGYYKDYGKGNLDEFFDKLNHAYELFVRKSHFNNFFFWLSGGSSKCIEVYIRETGRKLRLINFQDEDVFEEFPKILRDRFPAISDERVSSLDFFYLNCPINKRYISEEIDKQILDTSTTNITLSTRRSDGAEVSLTFPKSDLF